MSCRNLNTENSLMKFLGGHRGGVVSHFCLLKKQGILEASEMTETLRGLGVERLSVLNEFCPFAMYANEEFHKCKWHNKEKLK